LAKNQEGRKMLELTDYELVQKCIKGEHQFFSELVARYKKLIYNVVYNLTKDKKEVDDIVQEVFIKVFKSLSKYNPEYKFSTWSVTIARNLCVDLMRKKKVAVTSIEEIDFVSRDFNTPENKYMDKERALIIRRAIEQLPENYRTPVVLYYQKGKAYKEIAQMLNLPVTIIKNRLYRARMTLKESVACI
jgi:RNA polymerase sigma-70 factor (ECF subfamily)